MATAQQNIDNARKYLGVSGTDNIFNTWYWGFHCYDANSYPWCAAFQSYLAEQAGGLGYTKSAAASGIFNQLPRIDDKDVQPGDYVCFNWDGRTDTSWMDHIGMVTEFNYSTGYLKVIEGNGGGGGGCVKETVYNNNSSYFTAFCRPVYIDTPFVQPKKNTDTSGDVAIPQPRYCVYTEEDGQLEHLVGLKCEDGCGDDFAGIRGHLIRNVKIEDLGMNGWFQLTMKKQGILTKNTQNKDMTDYVIGVTVYYDTPNPADTGYYEAKYRVSPLGKDYLKWEYDDKDGGAGDDVNGIDRLQLTVERSA